MHYCPSEAVAFVRWVQRRLWLVAVAAIGVLYAWRGLAALCADIVVVLCVTGAARVCTIMLWWAVAFMRWVQWHLWLALVAVAAIGVLCT